MSTALPPEQQAHAHELAAAPRAAIADEIDQIARTLAATSDATVFGATEFALRELVHRVAAKALTLHLARKKTATRAPA
jgi:hypothetical protein